MTEEKTSPQPPQKKKRVPRQPSPHYATLAETAALFCADESTVRRAHGVFARLKQTKCNGRTLILRSSIDDLMYRLDRAAKSAVPDNAEFMNRRRKA